MEGEEEENEKEAADFNERDTAQRRRTRPEEGHVKERWQMERAERRRGSLS